MPIVARALTGDPTRLPRPAPWQDDDEELIVDAMEEEGLHRVMDMLLSELEQHVRATHAPGGGDGTRGQAPEAWW